MNVKLRVLSAGVLFFIGQSVVAQKTKNDTIKTEEIQEVVVLGYRTVSKKGTVSNSTTISRDKLEQRPNANVLNAVQGQISGLNIATGTGQPGAKPTVIIRGVGSLNNSTDPLYVIDGLPTNSDSFRTLNSNDIESFTVLKDASAIAEFGNRGSNGVIIIKTRKGSFGGNRMILNYRSQTGVSMLQEPKYRYSDAKQLLTLEKRRGIGMGAGMSDAAIANYGIDTDWKKEFFRESFLTSHDLSIQTNSENFNSYTNFGYYSQDGILRGTDLDRYSVRNNISGRSENRKFSYSVNSGIGFARNNEATSLGTGGINQNFIIGAYRAAPYISPLEYQNPKQLFQLYQSSGTLLYTPLFLIDKRETFKNITDDQKFNMSAEAKYEIAPGFEALVRSSGEYKTTRRVTSQNPDAFNSYVFQAAGQEFIGTETIANTREFYFDQLAQLNYEKGFGLHNFKLSGNFEYNFANYQADSFTQNGLNPRTFVPGTGSGYVSDTSANDFNVPTVSSNQLRLSFLSFFGSLDYDYDKRYGVTLTGRRDGTSRFAVGNQFDNFYSVGARWNVDEEAFMDGVSWVDELKFRGSYGTTGNSTVSTGSVFNGIRPPRFLNTYTPANNTYNGLLGYSLSFADPDIRWEKQQNSNLGVDFSLFNRRLSGSVDVYKKKSIDILDVKPQAPVVGTTGIFTNTDIQIENKGVEVELKYDLYRNRDREIRFSLFANGSYNDQKVFNVPNGELPGSITTTREGYKTDLPLVYHYVGVNASNGNPLYSTASGGVTENPVDADRVLGKFNYLPEYQGGFGFDLGIKGFYMKTLFSYVANVDRFDFDKSNLYDATNIGTFNVSSDLLNAWTPTNTSSNIPSLTANTGIDSSSDRFIVDASYVRIRNIQLGYTIPSKFFNNWFVNGISVFVQGENLYTWSKWEGFDAESNRGSDQGQYPTPKSFTLGFDIKF